MPECFIARERGYFLSTAKIVKEVLSEFNPLFIIVYVYFYLGIPLADG